MGTTQEVQPSELMAMTLDILQVAKAVLASLSGPLEGRHGLSLGEVDVLANLSMAPQGTLRMSRLSDALVTNRTAVTRLIDGLEAKGLVERRAAAGDRRAVNAAITDAGRDMFCDVRPFLEDRLRHELGDALSDEQATTLRSAMATILARLGRPSRPLYQPPGRRISGGGDSESGA